MLSAPSGVPMGDAGREDWSAQLRSFLVGFELLRVLAGADATWIFAAIWAQLGNNVGIWRRVAKRVAG